MEMSTFIPVKGYEDLIEVNQLGQVRNAITHALYTPRFNQAGKANVRVRVTPNKPQKCFLIHRLVANAFLPKPLPHYDVVLHLDNDTSNNQVSNLYWSTRAISQYKTRTDRTSLTIEEIKWIRQHAKPIGNMSGYKIAKLFPVSLQSIYNVINGKTFKNID